MFGTIRLTTMSASTLREQLAYSAGILAEPARLPRSERSLRGDSDALQPAGGLHPSRIERGCIDGLVAAYSEPQRVSAGTTSSVGAVATNRPPIMVMAIGPRRCCRRAGSFPTPDAELRAAPPLRCRVYTLLYGLS